MFFPASVPKQRVHRHHLPHTYWHNRKTMEYVIVTFSEARQVFVDGDVGGNTGEVLMVEKGTHRFQLSDPQDYTPQWRQPTVKNTTFANPMEVTFERE